MSTIAQIAKPAPCQGMSIPAETFGWIGDDFDREWVITLYLCRTRGAVCRFHPPVLRLALKGDEPHDIDFAAVDWTYDLIAHRWDRDSMAAPQFASRVIDVYLNTAERLIHDR